MVSWSASAANGAEEVMAVLAGWRVGSAEGAATGSEPVAAPESVPAPAGSDGTFETAPPPAPDDPSTITVSPDPDGPAIPQLTLF